MITTIDRRTNEPGRLCGNGTKAIVMRQFFRREPDGVTLRLAEEVAPHEGIAMDYAGREGAVRGRALRILIVDENCDFTREMARLLRMRGHWVQFAHTGAVALRLARAFQPEFVLIDVSLPDVSGFEIAALLPCVVFSGRLRVASVSDYCGEENFGLSQAAGCAFHLQRPVDVTEIEALLTGHGWDSIPA